MVTPNHPHISIIGSGPVGVQLVEEIYRRRPQTPITLFGNEPYAPYNRVQLSSYLAGTFKGEELSLPLPDPHSYPHFHYRTAHIRAIDTRKKMLLDAHNNTYTFDTLIFATGSKAHIPSIAGTNLSGVYCFRNRNDADALYARSVRSRHTVVIGGGLLGIEAAKSLLRYRTQVTLIQQAPRLMNRQLDASAASILKTDLEALGIQVILQSGVREIVGDTSVNGVRTRDGETIECDTILLCTGIQPNITLAREAGIRVNRGIVVNDQLQTSEPGIFAVGECTEHRGITYGLVQPGFEQAAVAAEVICGSEASYPGSHSGTRLKVLDKSVFSVGEVVDLADKPRQYQLIFKKNRPEPIYRQLVIHKGKLIGAAGVGSWPELERVHELVGSGRRLNYFSQLCFFLSGRLWPFSDTGQVRDWPASTIVCQCKSIRKEILAKSIVAGASTVSQLQECTGAGTVCGSCQPLLAQMCGQADKPPVESHWITTALLCMLTLVLAVILLGVPEPAPPESVQNIYWLQQIALDKTWKQITGFSLLGLALLGLLMSARKRLSWGWMGSFTHWRFVHIGLGTLCAFTLILHTGLHMGENLNQWLLLNFLTVLMIGAAAGGVSSIGQKILPGSSAAVRRWVNWIHIVATWPLPALLFSHVMSVYYF